MKRPDALDPGSIRYRFRKKRIAHVEMLLDGILAAKSTAKVLDIGGRRDYWRLLDDRFKGRIELTILNTKDEVALEDLDTDLGIKVETVVGDGCDMPQYADGAFDLAHSNSVIEHVGLLSDMARFADETRRVGRAYYLQTPNFWFPLEPHYGVPFFHWLPETMRVGLHTSWNVGYAEKAPYRQALTRVDHTRIINRRMVQELFPDGIHANERFAFMTKSVIVYRPYPEGEEK